MSTSWPALRWEEQSWDPGPGWGRTPRERALAGRRYRSALAPPITDRVLRVDSDVLAHAEDAAAAMARFDASGPIQYGAVIAILLRSESASSSQIEQISASARAVAEAELTGRGRGNAATVAANVTAMRAALELSDHLDVSAVAAMQAALLQESAPHMVGWRTEPVWIGGGSSTPVDADFVPPHHTRLAAGLEDLVTFMERTDLPVLVQAAIAHAQFETLHPFPDGNGRTGRALVHAFLRRKGLTRSVTVPVSGGLLADRERYIAALTTYRAGRPEAIVRVFADAALHAVDHGGRLAAELTQLQRRWETQLTARVDSAAWRLLVELPAHPVLDASTAAELIGSDRRNVHRHLRALVDAGILRSANHHGSGRILFRAPEVLQALDTYAEAVGRRSRG
ncbi:Fic family protein [Luteipulveratus flavus]|uniref:Fic family protein n=1 Tax=Luteipulveratus flavus TaxID=3031728 RepID=A0ABT6C7K5_9MICO|nr:Fic family protein [Luteipulveratus sp. YIM 133296]MDF8264914.1 Fic family protein [Luteipulveratus sp. YIM 133296]